MQDALTRKCCCQNELSSLINIINYLSTPYWNIIANLDRERGAVYLCRLTCYLSCTVADVLITANARVLDMCYMLPYLLEKL